jgi:xanthine dehydrogenase YagR molybdenum-binding subunit
MANNTTHRPATIQRIRIGASLDGKITAIAHESTSGNLPGGKPETAVAQTKLLYAGANRLTFMKLAVLDLPEGNAMRAPGNCVHPLAVSRPREFYPSKRHWATDELVEHWTFVLEELAN